MTKSRKKTKRPALLRKSFKDPYSSLARSNVGSFLDWYLKKYKAYDGPRKMLPAFIQYLSSKQPELAGFIGDDINTKDATTKGFYDILRNAYDNRKKRPPTSPKPPREEESFVEPHMLDHNQSFQKRPPSSTLRQERNRQERGQIVDDEPLEPVATPTKPVATTPHSDGGPNLRKKKSANPDEDKADPKSDPSSDNEEKDEEDSSDSDDSDDDQELATHHTVIQNQLKMLREEEVLQLSFDYNPKDEQLKVTYIVQTPNE